MPSWQASNQWNLNEIRKDDQEFTGVCEFEVQNIRPKWSVWAKIAEILTNLTIPVESWDIFGLFLDLDWSRRLAPQRNCLTISTESVLLETW